MDIVTLQAAKAASRKESKPNLLTEPSQFYRDSNNRIGGGTTAYTVIGTDSTSGRMYLYRPGAIVQSDDLTLTFSNARTLPSGVSAGSVAAVVEFLGNVYLHASDGTSFGVWKSPVVSQSGDWSWSSKLISLPAGTTALANISLTKSSWANNNVLLLSTYGDPVGGSVLYKSTDGNTFTSTWSRSTSRHIHHCEADPYLPGHIVLTCGDGISDPIIHSYDYGMTWTPLVASRSLQGVQISFTATDIWIASDSLRSNVIIIDRKTLTPKYGSTNFIASIVPPYTAGRRARSVTDLATTAGNTTVASASANFTAEDKGRYIQADGLLSPGAFITNVASATQVSVNTTAIGSASGNLGTPTTYISGDTYFANAFMGLIDPQTEIWYQIASDTSAAGQVFGLFYLNKRGGRLEILDPGGLNYPLTRAAIIHAGYLWCGNLKYKLLTQIAS